YGSLVLWDGLRSGACGRALARDPALPAQWKYLAARALLTRPVRWGGQDGAHIAAVPRFQPQQWRPAKEPDQNSVTLPGSTPAPSSHPPQSLIGRRVAALEDK